MGVGLLLMLNSDTGMDRIAHVYPFTLSHIPGRVRITILSNRELRFSLYICSFHFFFQFPVYTVKEFSSALHFSPHFLLVLSVPSCLEVTINPYEPGGLYSPWGRKESDTPEVSTERERSVLIFIPFQSSCVSAAHSPVRKSLRSQLFS